MQYYDELATYERDGYTVIVDKTYEDINPRDCFDTDDMDEILRKINNGTYEWFMLRVRVLVEGLELGSAYLGGCLYEDPREVLSDGTAEDFIAEAMTEAKSQVYRMSKKFAELSDQVDRESASA
jgi:hypothetical protein